MKILVVDDDVDFMNLFILTLAGLGFRNVASAGSAAEALARVEAELVPFDLFVLDVRMPKMDGIELCRAIRELPRYATAPILMNTSLSDKDSVTSAFAAGATDYVNKPIDPIELSGRLRVMQLLVDERLANNKRSDVVEHGDLVQARSFSDPIFLEGVESANSTMAMGNYLASLNVFDRGSIVAIGIHTLNGQEIFDTQGAQVFSEIMFDIATCISEVLPPEGRMIAYKGSGDFIVLLPRGLDLDRWDMEKRLQSYILEFAAAYNELEIQTPTIAVGPSITCRFSGTGSPSKLIDDAASLARQSQLVEVSHA